MAAVAAPAAAPTATTRTDVAVLDPRVARLLAFAALALFGALHWARLVQPVAAGGMWAATAAAVGAGTLLTFVMPARRRDRVALIVLTGVALFCVALLAAGVRRRLLVPDQWGSLADGIGQGVSALPGVSVPYRGVDEWARIALLLGGSLLVGLAALLAFAGAPGRGLRSVALPAEALGALYAIPVIEHHPDQPFAGGAVFAVLLCAFLWLERVERRFAVPALVMVLAASGLGLVIGPAFDAARPWLDYEQLAQDLTPRSATQFTWNHRYGPLDWPRDGREIIRVRARSASYWKAVNLEQFDGVRWREGASLLGSAPDTEIDRRHPEWRQRLRVVVRNLRSPEFIGAGTTIQVTRSPRTPVETHPGVFSSLAEPLMKGNAYFAEVYVPKPSQSELGAAGTAYPDFVQQDLSMSLPRSVGGPGRVGDSGPQILFTQWGFDAPAITSYDNGAVDRLGTQLVLGSRYGRMYRLAQRLKAQSATAYAFVRRVQQRVRAGAIYTESPPPAQIPLDTFLFEKRLGYCQQFSGAMALLLRMGGVPARVASGFAPGTLDRSRGEYVVRDLDAHSWVEAYFPHLGWVTFDPTPAIAPPRTQSTGEPASVPEKDTTTDIAARGDVSAQASKPGAAPAAENGGFDWRFPAIAGGVLLALLALLAGWMRRNGTPETLAGDPLLSELQVALHRTGRTPPAEMTLARLEVVLAGSPGAGGYVRALREQRFANAGAGAGGPSTEQRRALREELGVGLGVRGRLRAWWALPPRWRLRGRAYTQT